MRRTLLLFRHAKSDWDADYEDDHERPLAPRGTKAARLMGKLLAAAGQVPDCAVTSSAVRARETLRLAIAAGEWSCPVIVDEDLYETDVTRALRRIQEIDNCHESALLTGHEPTWSELAAALVGGGSFRFPTAALMRIDFEIDTWREAAAGRGELVWFQTPRFFSRGRFSI